MSQSYDQAGSVTQSEAEIEKRVRSVIAEMFHLSPQEAEGQLGMGNPAGWDSLGHMELVIQLEKEFGVTFPNFVLADLVSVPAIVRAVRDSSASA
ncbi:MAG: hypothetical protein AUG51_10375 [Acidobacteria bacterium 13_1_20CM_3_53_8]|nr:MAG: hypothetical protein AUG51_10375 [Acidobacteria bacterium 13_1_20CM_3_53_8]